MLFFLFVDENKALKSKVTLSPKTQNCDVSPVSFTSDVDDKEEKPSVWFQVSDHLDTCRQLVYFNLTSVQCHINHK